MQRSGTHRLPGYRYHPPSLHRYAAYHDCCFTTRRYVRGCSPVPPLAPLIFCGGEVRIEEPTMAIPTMAMPTMAIPTMAMPTMAMPTMAMPTTAYGGAGLGF